MDIHYHGGIRTRVPRKQTHASDRTGTGIGLCDISLQLHRATNGSKMNINDDGIQK